MDISNPKETSTAFAWRDLQPKPSTVNFHRLERIHTKVKGSKVLLCHQAQRKTATSFNGCLATVLLKAKVLEILPIWDCKQQEVSTN